MKTIELLCDWLTQNMTELTKTKKMLNCHQTPSLAEDGVWG